MKKIITLVLLSIFTYSTASSQILIALLFGEKLNGEKLEFGLNVGINASTVSNIDAGRYSYGFNIGMNFLYKFNDRLHLNNALFFSYPMGANNLPLYETPDSNLNKVLEHANLQRKLSYFSLPVTMRYRMFGLTFVDLGTQVSLRTNAIDLYTVTIDDNNKLYYHQQVRDEYTLFDFGFTAGITQRLRKKGGVTISLKYYHGVVDVHKNGDGTQYNSTFYATVAIPIGADNNEK